MKLWLLIQKIHKKFSRNIRGFSLVEIMIVSGIMGGMALALTQLMTQANKGKKDVELRYEYIEALNKIRMYLSDAEVCRNTFVTGTATNAPAPYTFPTDATIHPVTAIFRTSRNGVNLASPAFYYSVEAHASGKGIINRKLRITAMRLVVNDGDKGAGFLPAAGTRETRLFDVEVDFASMGVNNELPGSSNRQITIAAEIDSTGRFLDCYTDSDEISQTVCEDMGGAWDPNGAPNRCIIRDVSTDYVCQELGGTIVLANRRVQGGSPNGSNIQRGVGLPGTIAPNTPNLTTNTPLGGAQKVCDIKEVTNRDACSFMNGQYDNVSNTCSLTNNTDLRQMACAIAGGGPAIGGGSITQFFAAGGTESESGSYCQQTTEGACLAVGGFYGGGLNSTGNSDDTCTIDCTAAAPTTIFNNANNTMCGLKECTDMRGVWNSGTKTCDLSGDSRLREYACTTAGGVWNGNNDNVFTLSSSATVGECSFNTTHFETMCEGIGGPSANWIGQPTNQCQISGERLDDAIKRAACENVAKTINTTNNTLDPVRTFTAVASYAGGICTMSYTTSILTESYANGRYGWKHPTNSMGFFNTVGSAASVAGGSNNIAIGNFSQALDGYSIAMGYDAVASDVYNIAIGYSSSTSNSYTMAAGYNATASNESASAIGASTVASGYQSSAIGYSSVASAETSFAAGVRAQATGIVSTAVGAGKNECLTALNGMCTKLKLPACCFTFTTGPVSSGARSTALGAYALSSGASSIAIGAGATASGNASFAAGEGTVAAGAQAIAIGNSAVVDASASNGVSIGYSTAIGPGASSATVVGNSSTIVNGADFSVAVGTRADVTSPSGWAISIGADSVAAGYQSTAVGDLASATGDDATAIGADANAIASSTALGANCNNNVANTVLLCSGGGVAARITASGTVTVSSRDQKRNFVEIDSRAESYLEGLSELPMYQFMYKSDKTNTKVLGPMAEDFYQLFKLGDGKTIAEFDMRAVVLLSIKAMYFKLKYLDQEHTSLKKRVEVLENDLDQLKRDIEELKAAARKP